VDLLLTEPQTLFAESATRLCFDHGGPKRLRALRAATAEMDAETWRAIVEAGWVATTVAEARGGQDLGASGLGAFDLALALEQVGRPPQSHRSCRGSPTLRVLKRHSLICCAARA
jgi:alkylation response protein AidB-like acyl-CoA dehydrogenase